VKFDVGLRVGALEHSGQMCSRMSPRGAKRSQAKLFCSAPGYIHIKEEMNRRERESLP